jgi:hypothetical protein
MANAVIFPDTGKLLKHSELITLLRYKTRWMRSTANEIGRLAQGLKRGVKGTNIIRFIRRTDIPPGGKPTYGSFVVDIKTHKEETERTRLTVGGDQIECLGDKSTRIAGLTTAKMLFNSTISTPGAKFLVIDIVFLNLNTPLERYEYMVIMMASLPQEVIYKYCLDDLAVDGKVYVKIHKGIYGLPQVDILANELLQQCLAQDGYRPTNHIHGLWTHNTRPITFSLVVDNLGIKYVGQEHADHLKASIEKHYQMFCDWKGSAYCGLQLDWDYKNGCVDLSMRDYTKAALHKFQHPTRPENAPHIWSPPIYGAKTQYIEEHKDIPLLPQKEITHIQQLCGTLLYYALAVDPTLTLPVNVLASDQTQATAATADKAIKLLNYCASHPEAKLRYHASDMILNIHSDAYYLSEREAKSRAGGFFYLGSNITSKSKLTNGAILIISTILKHIMFSAAEADIGSVFLNAKEATILRTTLIEMGHPQPPTPLQTDNTTSMGYSNNTLKQRRTRSMDMLFYWVKDRVRQGQFHVYWGPGYQHLSDYFTKHHSPTHHKRM